MREKLLWEKDCCGKKTVVGGGLLWKKDCHRKTVMRKTLLWKEDYRERRIAVRRALL